MKELEKSNIRARTRNKRRQPSTIAGLIMVAAGVIALAFSVYAASTILVFMGLGLTFWGALLLFIRPQKYVKSVLMDSTALSSLRTIDRIMTSLGYMRKASTYLEEILSERLCSSQLNRSPEFPGEKRLRVKRSSENPKGLAMIPPGLALATLIEKELGVDLKKCSLGVLGERLPNIDRRPRNGQRF